MHHVHSQGYNRAPRVKNLTLLLLLLLPCPPLCARPLLLPHYCTYYCSTATTYCSQHHEHGQPYGEHVHAR